MQTKEEVRKYQREWQRKRRSEQHDSVRATERKAEQLYRKSHRAEINTKRRAYVKAHPERIRATRQRWYQKNRERVLAKMRARPDRCFRKYRMTAQQRDAEIIKQHGKCKICDKPLTQPHIDHCHKTKVFRGILCPRCNHMLGHAKDDPTILERGAAYLRDTPKASLETPA